MRKYILLLVFLLIVIPVGLLVAALESEPLVPPQPVVTPEDAKRAREFVRAFWALTESPDRNQTLTASEQDLDSTLKFATRAFPFVRVKADVVPWGVRFYGSLELPFGQWFNVTTEVEPSGDRFEVTEVRVGSIPLPAAAVLPVARTALNVVLGDGLGRVAVESIGGIRINGETVAFRVDMTRAERRALLLSAKTTVRSVAGVAPAEQVGYYWLALERAAARGPASKYHSFAGYLQETVSLVVEALEQNPQWDAEREMQSALLALAIYCGHPQLQSFIGEAVPDKRAWRRTACASATLGGRHDLRQHFAVSVGLKTASEAGLAFAIGEAKELLDANQGGSGFSFDDIAADRAGIEFAERMLAARPEDWRVIAAFLGAEETVFPSISGLPSQMSKAEFESRFGAVDSAQYKAMLREIDSRIASLPFFITF